jgi:ATP-dependent RNA helicase DeaD
VNSVERAELLRIGKRFSIEFQERPLPGDEDVARIVAERVINLLEARLRNRDRLQVERMQRFLPLVRSLGENEDEGGLLAMLLDDFYQETFHAPLTPPENAVPSTSSRPQTNTAGKRNPRSRRTRRS